MVMGHALAKRNLMISAMHGKKPVITGHKESIKIIVYHKGLKYQVHWCFALHKIYQQQ